MLDWINEIDPSFAVSNWRAFVPLAIAGVIVWALWLYRCILSRAGQAGRERLRAPRRRWSCRRTTRTPDILMRAWTTGARRTRPRSSSCSTSPTPRRTNGSRPWTTRVIKPVLFQHAGKRSALGVGHPDGDRASSLVLVDSDTQWEPGLLADGADARSLDPEVGAVSTQQNVYQRAQQRLAPDRRLDGQPALLQLRARHGPRRRGRLRVRPHRGVPPRRGRPGARATWRTSSSSAAAASPATTAG